ncbi:MAG: diacylglycerol kinase [Desulfuromonas sp.]|nr:MAG: diacylglycerol kinase [Desulfuromonas sp.]
MKPKNWLESLNCAIEGILWAAKNERHLRLHFFVAVAVLLAALLLGLSALDFILLTFAITLVLFAELVNTAIEVVIDLVSPEYHPLARQAKDLAAGAVLVASIGAVVMGFFAFSHYFFPVIETELGRTEQIVPIVSVVSLIIVVIVVVLLKAGFGRGVPLHGGMPSGHAAVSFSIATSVLLSHSGIVLVSLVFLVAFLVSHSRLLLGIHTYGEVIAGSVLGFVVTYFIYLVFN